MIRIACVGCDKVEEVEISVRGRPKFFHDDACRLATYRRVRNNPVLQKEIQRKKDGITQQYREARQSSMSKPGLRKRAMIVLQEAGWSKANIGKAFGISDERVGQIIGDRKEKL